MPHTIKLASPPPNIRTWDWSIDALNVSLKEVLNFNFISIEGCLRQGSKFMGGPEPKEYHEMGIGERTSENENVSALEFGPIDRAGKYILI